MKKLAVVIAAAMVVAGCGSSSGTHSATPTSGGTHAAPSGAPIKIALLGFETGVYATPDRHNAIDLAIKQINSAGGVNGHMLQYTAYDTGVLPQTTLTAVQKAISDHPTVILGLAVSSGVQAAAAALKSSGIPTIQEGQDNSTDLSALGVTNMFRGQPSVHEQSQAAVNYLTSLHPTSVGVFDDSDLNSVQAVKVIKAGLQANGVQNIVYRQIPQTGTDATEAALAMRGVSMTTSDGFPVQESIFVRALATNGVGVHDLMGNSGLLIAEKGLAPWSAVAGSSTYTVCDPTVLQTPQAQQYVSGYKTQFPSDSVALSNPVMYDAVQLIGKAVQAQNGDISLGAIVKGLGTVSYDGVCGHFQSDSQHTLAHTMYIVQFGSQPGQHTLVARYDNMASS
jgi:branched-chain amino acid transport system substrate-binding protein